MSGPTADELLAALDPEQREVALALRGPVRVLAGAGTGKTRAVTHRIAYGVASGVYDPRHVLAVTFTTRAAGEMRGRLRAMGAGAVQARTFHSAALRQVRWFWPKVYGGEPPALVESKIPLLAAAARRQRLDVDQARLRDLASEVEWAKVSNVRPDDYPRLAQRKGREVTGVDPAVVARVMTSYEDLKRDQGRIDMEDVLLCAAALLTEDERVAAEVRAQYRHFTVDEYQDLSPIQSALLDLWLGGRDELCVVGDPAQTIYSFAGARADYLLDFTARHPAATTVELVRSYRSTPQVVETANRLLSGGSTRSVRLQAQRAAGPDVRLGGHPDEVAEAAAVAARARVVIDGGRPASEVAVLFRINAQSEAYEDALTEAGVPYVIRGAARFFDRPEVREAVTRIRGAARGGVAVEDGADWRDAVADILAGMGWTPTPPEGRGQTRDRWESWQALVSQAEGHQGDLASFVDELDRRAAEQHAPVAEGVTLATFHAAKGLEWDTVFLVGLQDGTLPLVHADTPEAVEEERRLLYVGMTRARSDLGLSWAAARNPGQAARRKPSRFLAALLPDEQPTPARGRRRAATCRECGRPLSTAAEAKRGRCADCPASYDEELFEQLRAWRRRRAEEAAVPPYVVFTDSTLQLIAEHKPTDARGLLALAGIGPKKLEDYGEDLLAMLA